MSRSTHTGGEEREETLGRGIDYLGAIYRMLRDLSGLASLVYELLQNADDAPDATVARFDLTTDALIVWNDGQFTNCGRQDDLSPDQCPWRDDPEREQMCDFHRFRSVSAGDKGRRADLTGAFGIGFTAVYQITDLPEIISAGQHWRIDETRAESERITVIRRSPIAAQETGTRFILPWARDPDSPFRRRPGAPPVDTSAPSEFGAVLEKVVPTALLFLRRIRRVELLRDSVPYQTVTREDDGADVLIADAEGDKLWRVIKGDFAEEAELLREKYPGKLEKSSEIALALPFTSNLEGLLCAYLPTEERTGMPFHVNADFFLASDRKRLMVAGFQGEWNMAAIRSCASLLARHLTDLPDVCGPKHLWSLLVDAHSVSTDASAKARDLSLDSFWDALEPNLRTSPILKTVDGSWVAPESARLVRDREEEAAAEILSGLGEKFASSDLREFLFRLPYDRSLGMRQLRIDGMVDLLLKHGLDRRRDIKALPEQLEPEEARRILVNELNLLLTRAPQDLYGASEAIGRLALAPGSDQALWPWNRTFQADPPTQQLFGPFAENATFLDGQKLPEGVANVKALAKPFRAPEAIRWLEAAGHQVLLELMEAGSLEPADLFTWFEDHRPEFIDDASLTDTLAQLPLYPSESGFRSLSEVALPGDFSDELGLAGILDTSRVGDNLQLLRRLGAAPLTFARYASEFVPQAVGLSTEDPERWWRLILLMSEKLGQIEDDRDLTSVLRQLPIVRTSDGSFARPDDAYFASSALGRILGTYRTAFLPDEHRLSVEAFYRWAGVATNPRDADLIERIVTLTEDSVTSDAVAAIAAAIEFIAGQPLPTEPRDWGDLRALTTMDWLPALGDSVDWHKPGSLYVTFQEYLFSSQGRFLNIPRPVQNAAALLLTRLGVQSIPSTEQIVAHLLHCSHAGIGMNQEVYTVLNQRAKDAAIGRLEGQASLLLPSGTWVNPQKVFWGDHPFGKYRTSLGPDFRRFADLLGRLGVRENPDHDDAAEVLLEMETEFGASNVPLEDDFELINSACWQMLADGLANDTVQEKWFDRLTAHKVVRDPRGVLSVPSRILFDDVPGMADRFPQLLGNNLIRRPEGAWRAMRAAGVRDLSTAVSINIIELGERTPDTDLSHRVEERERQISRVLDAVDSAWTARLSAAIDGLQITSTTELSVAYSLDEFRLKAPPAALEALYVAADSTLYVASGKDRSWLTIARELARVVAPDAPPGSLAANLALVMGAATIALADRDLDNAGVPRLEQAREGQAIPAVVEGFGGEGAPAGAGEGASSQGENGSESKGDPTGDTPASGAGRDATGDGTRTQPGQPNGTPGRSSTTPPGGGRPGDGRGHDDRHEGEGPRGRLRSYVVPAGAAANSDVDGSLKTEADAAVDRAGVQRVLEFERLSGRTPKEKPHGFPGYDIESAGTDGAVERYIEVKSLGGPWDSYGVSVSPRQMKEARERGDEFWLYVVARAERPDFSIHCIQNPRSKVDQFMFDSAWIEIGETAVAGRPIPPVSLVDAGSRSPNRLYLPFYDIPSAEPGSSGAEAGWAEWGDAAAGAYLVRTLGNALAPAAPEGSLVVVEPLGSDSPEAGEAVLLILAGQDDPETETDLAFRIWPQPLKSGTPNGSLSLQALNPEVAPLVVADPGQLSVLGRVRIDSTTTPEPG